MASQILFGKTTAQALKGLDEQTFLEVFEGVPQSTVDSAQLEGGLDLVAALSGETGFLNSNGEARRALKENSISVNKEKVSADRMLTTDDLISGRYILLQRGKRSYFVLIVK